MSGKRHLIKGSLPTLHVVQKSVVTCKPPLRREPVVASTSDKGSANVRFYKMHGIPGEICYKSTNLFAPTRYIYFFSDVPHLVKTIRNNVAKSGFGTNTKYLWNNDRHILWQHVVSLYQHDLERELQRTKLTAEHVYLTPHSVMRVNLAAQVFSNSVGRVMETYGGSECGETAKFICLVDRFFDCLNVRSLTEGFKKKKPDLMPYTSADDSRYQFLIGEFLQYLTDWKQSVATRPGDFSNAARKKMFLSEQTYEGIYRTVMAFVECTKFLLNSGVSFVLSNKFNQDPLEAHFGRHRGAGRRSENPSLWNFGYQENKLRLQRSLALQITPKGNVRTKRIRKDIVVTYSPLKKRKKSVAVGSSIQPFTAGSSNLSFVAGPSSRP